MTDRERIAKMLGFASCRMEVTGKGSARTREARKGKRKDKHLNHIVWGA